jgi:hypothetical protein
MGSLKDALKAWKAEGKAKAESLDRANQVAQQFAHLPRAPVPQARAPSSPKAPGSAKPSIAVTAPKPGVDYRTGSMRPLGKVEHFCPPADWVKPGASLQAPGADGGRILTVRVGVDFGTAYTKVAIGAAQKVFFVDWSGLIREPQSLFLPGVLSVEADGRTFVGRSPTASEYLTDLKLPFLPGAQSDKRGRVAVMLYLAWVLRYSRAWFFQHHAALCKGRSIAWEVNVGCPTKAWDEKAQVDLYEFIGHAAWRLSLGGDITRSRAEALLDSVVRPFESEGLDALGVVPEFVAQIAGYARSPQRRRSLHLLVDCGAGTVDAVMFNVHKDGDEDVYPIFAASVEPLGGHFLMARRAEVLGAGTWDDSDTIPAFEDLIEVFPEGAEMLKAVDDKFRSDVARVVSGLITYTRQRRSPLASAWEMGLPVFITGGGANCAVYRDAVETGNARAKGGLVAIQLPRPSGAEEFAESDFHRASVAFGLTFDKDSLGKVIPAKDIEDFLATAALPVRGREDRDEKYAK